MPGTMTVVRRRWLPVLSWLMSVVAATTVGLAAVSLLAAGITSTATTPLSQDAVARALASATANSTPNRDTRTPSGSTSNPPDSPSPTPAPTSRPTTESSTPGTTRSLSSPGGTVIAQCQGEQVYLVSWSPAQGWQVDEYVRGPARSTMVQFELDDDSENDRDVTVSITCRSGQPVSSNVEADD